MKRALGLVALLALASCKEEIPGVTCKSDLDCPGGWCDQELCFDCECGAFQDCDPGKKCVPAFTALAITVPGSGASVNAPFKVSAELTRKSGGQAAGPASIALAAKPATGALETFTLAREGDTLTYSATITTRGGGAYSLTASASEIGLTSAAVPVTVVAAQCSPACSGLEDCIGGSCSKAFEKIEITSPENGASFTDKAAGIAVEARIVRASGSLRGFPASVALSGSSESGETATAALAGSGDGTYAGTFAPPEGGKWNLTASSTDVQSASEKVAILVDYCPQVCGTWLDCEAGLCVQAFVGLAITSPAEGATVGASVEVRAEILNRRNGTKPGPASVDVEIVHGGNASHLELAKDAARPTEYFATWNVPEAGAFALTPSSGAVTQPSQTVHVTADLTAPSLTVTVLPGPNREAREVDDKSPTKDTERKRNEKVRVQIESSDADLDPSSVKVEVAGPTGGKLAVTPGSCATMPAGYCSEAEIDLGNPVLEMKAFRGTAKVTVTASDTVKNLGTGSADVAVTRFKWKVDPETGKSIKAAPAIGENGNVYVVTTNGKVSVLRPDGSPNWWFQTGSAENASIAVSDVDSVETAFVSGVAVGAGAVWAATSSASGTNPPAVCSSGTQPLGAIAITEFMFDGDAQALVGAVAGFRQSTGSKLAVARPSAPTTGTPCQTLPLDTAIGPESGFAVQSNGKVFFGDELGNLRLVELIAGGPTPKWSKATGILIPANPVITDIGVALGGSSVVSGGLFRIALDGTGEAPAAAGTPLWNLLDVKTATGNSVAAGSGDGHLFVEDEAFAAVTAPAALAPKMTLSGAIKAAPAFGSDKALYIASADQKLFVRDLQGNALWDAELGSSSYSSPALDCARDSNGQAISAPGVVYVGADDGFLYAFITDSHGLDVDSPWPKFHRDPKNRANTGFDLTTFRCP